jgi:hypothetical protein
MAKNAWLTGDDLAGSTFRYLEIPGDLTFLMSVTGALLPLTFDYNWEKFGTVEPEDAAYAMRLMLMAYLKSTQMPAFGSTELLLFGDSATVKNGNAIVLVMDTAQRFGGYYQQNTAANGDKFEWTRWMDRGDWAYKFYYQRTTASAQVNIRVSDAGGLVENVTVDEFGATQANTVFNGSFTLTKGGETDISMEVTGRTADIDPPRRCICIPVPNEPAHRQAFFGALTQLGYQFNWERDDEHNAVPVSVLWMGIVTEAMHKFYNGAETMCFSCEELSECLAPLLEAQTAIFQQMLNVSKFGDNVQPGVPMTETQKNTDMTAGTNPTCNLSITWAQCQQVIAYGDALIRQSLVLAESATNDLEILQVFTSLPVIDELGADAIAGYAETFLEGIQDNYYAQASPTYLEESACALFCLAKEECTITPDMIYSIFYDRVTERFGTPITAITTIGDLFFYLVDQDIDGTIIADVMMLVVFGGGVLAQAFIGDAGTKSLVSLLLLAVNDANDDYLILCTDCPEDWTYTIEIPDILDWDDYVEADAGLADPTGWIANPASTFAGTAIFGIATSAPFECLSIDVFITDPMTGDENSVFAGDLALASTVIDTMGSATEFELPVGLTLDGLAIGYFPNSSGAGSPDFPGATYKVVVHGTGYQPPELGG